MVPIKNKILLYKRRYKYSFQMWDAFMCYMKPYEVAILYV